MEIVSGLFDRMVLQRNRRGVCDAVFAGRCEASGVVQCRASRQGRVVRGCNWIRVGKAAKGRFSGRLKGLPAGGPYDVRLRIVSGQGRVLDSLDVADVLVGDVWILGGQSNMEGVGRLTGLKADRQVRAFYMDDRWDVARDPIHNLQHAVDQVHHVIHGCTPVRDRRRQQGPGVSFGQEMRKRTGVPQGLIPSAHGGTSMREWDAANHKRGRSSLFGAMVRRFEKNGAKVAGVIWYQGCSDANADDAPKYTARMKKFVSATRKALGEPRLPFVVVQIARVFGIENRDAAAWNSVRDQQRRLGKVIDRLAVVPAIDLELDDSIHISGEGQIRLGRRLADAALAMIDPTCGAKRPIELKEVKCSIDRYMQAVNITVRFANVVGELTAPGRPEGFAICDASGKVLPVIYRTETTGNRVLLRTTLVPADTKGLQLYYGFGCSPYCNITDHADRSLPAFGPLRIA